MIMRPTALLIVILSTSTPVVAGEIDVYLLGGQSNMQGIAKIAKLPPDVPKAIPHAFFWTSRSRTFEPMVLGKTRSSSRPGEFGPEIGFALEMATADRPIYLIKYAASGMPLHHGWSGNKWVGGDPRRALSNFYPGTRPNDTNQGKHYRGMLRKFRTALQHLKKQGHTPVVRGFVWMQGEQDSKHQTSATTYATSLKRLCRRLSEELGLDKNTAVFFTSDNGGVSTAGGHPTSNAPLRAGKGWLYEGGIREPMIIRCPGITQAGTECSVPVTSTDFYPTILELTGVASIPQQHMDGVSLVPLLKGAKSLPREAIYWHYPHYSGGLGGRPSAVVRAGDWKLIEFLEDRHLELYNLKDDIGEKTDLAEAQPEKTKELREMLHAWQKQVAAKFPTRNPNYKQPLPALQ